MTSNDIRTKSIISWYGLAFTVPAAVYLALLSLVVKVIQVSAIEEGFDFVTLIQAWSPDLALSLFLAGGFGVAFSLLPRWRKVGLAIPFYLFIAYASVMTIASNFYFIKTGSNFSWSTIEYWLKNFEDTNKIMSSEGGGLKLVLSIGQLLVLAAIIALPLIPVVRRSLQGWRPMGLKWSGFAAGGAILGSILFGLVPASQGPAMAACRNIPMAIVMDFVHEVLLPKEMVEIGEDEKLDASLEVKAKEGAVRRNVVLIMFESLRWNSSDVYVPGLGSTPYLESLAQESAVVENQYSILPHTTKAVTAINCGIYPYISTDPMEATPGILPRRCLPHILRSQGYRTAFFQPAANFEKRDLLVSNMGYETYKGLNEMPHEGFEEINYFGREERMMLQPSMDWVDSVKGQPFLLTYLTLCTHHNYVTPQSWPQRRYVDHDEDLNNYLNGVRYTDDFIRQVMEGLEERGVLENSIVIVVGDHGEAFGEHGRRQHDLIMWEEGIRSFSLWHAPGIIEGGTRVKGWRSHLDIVPSVLDLLDIEVVKGGFQGQTLFEQAPENRKEFYSCWFQRRCLAMREGPIKVIYHFDQLPMEVYDNSTDAFDQHNLAFKGDYNGPWMESRKEEMLRWSRVVNQQYEEWAESILDRVVSDQEPEYDHRLSARFDDKIELVGYSLSKSEVRAGESLEVKLVFKALAPLKATDALFVHGLGGRSGTINADHVPAGGAYPLQRWQPGEYIVDEFPVHVPATWGRGDLKLAVGFWNKASKKRFAVESSAETRDERLVFAEVPVLAAARVGSAMTLEQRRARIGDWISFERPEVATTVGARFGDGVVLEGVEFHRLDVPLAGTVEMTYTFKALREGLSDWRLSVKLIRDDGVSIDGDHEPLGGLYPPRFWREGEYVRDRHRIHIDGNSSKPGTYGVYVGFFRGRAPVKPSGDFETDGEGRVRIGTAVISRPTQPHK